MTTLGKPLRTRIRAFIGRHRWLPIVTALMGWSALILALRFHTDFYVTAGAGLVLMAASFGWGYSAHARRQTLWPPLEQFHRRQYAEVWDALTPSATQAAEAATGKRDEAELRRSGEETVRKLKNLVAVGPQDDVLEIGCGVGRVGLVLASQCGSWTGADISANMLRVAADRLRGLSNVRLAHLESVGLAKFSDNSFDVVYTTDMFEHLDEVDRWRYVEEAFRVLRPGGRFYMDNLSLEVEEGWTNFARDARLYRDLERPPWYPRYSTAAELITYAKQAGFEQVQQHSHSPTVIVTGKKSQGPNLSLSGKP